MRRGPRQQQVDRKGAHEHIEMEFWLAGRVATASSYCWLLGLAGAAAKGGKLLAQILSHPFHAWLRDLCAHA